MNTPLTPEDLRERLRLHSPALVKELYDTVLRQMQNETDRQQRLDAKATFLLNTIGVSISFALVLAFGAQILFTHTPTVQDTSIEHWWLLLTLFAVLGISGIGTMVLALMGLSVGNHHPALNEHTIFHPKELREASRPGYDHGDEIGGVMEYRKYLLVEMWRVVQQTAIAIDRKARFVQLGQMSFCVFFATLIGIVVAIWA